MFSHFDSFDSDSRLSSYTTDTQVLFVIENWRASSEKAAEFLKFVQTIAKHTPRKLSDEDITKLDGKCFRGTSALLAVLSLYRFNNIFSITDFNVFSTSKVINVKSFLVSENAQVALNYANKYIDRDGKADSFARYEKPIFERFLQDNDLAMIAFPLALLQPVLLAFDRKSTKSTHHKAFESELFGEKPNQCFMRHLSELFNIPDMQAQFPLLAASLSLQEKIPVGFNIWARQSPSDAAIAQQEQRSHIRTAP